MSDETINSSEGGGYRWMLDEVFGDKPIELPAPIGETPPAISDQPAPTEAPSPTNPAWTKATACARCGRIRDETVFLSLTPPWNVATHEILICAQCLWHLAEWALEQMNGPRRRRKGRSEKNDV